MSTQPVPMHSQEAPQSSDNSSSAPPRYICFGTYHLDPKKEELFKDGARVKLQGKVYQAPVALQAPRQPEPTPAQAIHARAASLLRTAFPSKWFAVGMVVLVIASTLFG